MLYSFYSIRGATPLATDVPGGVQEIDKLTEVGRSEALGAAIMMAQHLDERRINPRRVLGLTEPRGHYRDIARAVGAVGFRSTQLRWAGEIRCAGPGVSLFHVATSDVPLMELWTTLAPNFGIGALAGFLPDQSVLLRESPLSQWQGGILVSCLGFFSCAKNKNPGLSIVDRIRFNNFAGFKGVDLQTFQRNPNAVAILDTILLFLDVAIKLRPSLGREEDASVVRTFTVRQTNLCLELSEIIERRLLDVHEWGAYEISVREISALTKGTKELLTVEELGALRHLVETYQKEIEFTMEQESRVDLIFLD
jgi:hypothetical protein